MTFVVMGLTTIVHMYNSRSHLSIFKVGFTGNKLLLGTTIMGTIILRLMTAIPQVAKILNLTSLGFGHWVVVAILSIFPLIFIEVQKRVGRFGKL